jgi:mannose-6-phosphate isomerase-like protein (cupin superfamily)
MSLNKYFTAAEQEAMAELDNLRMTTSDLAKYGAKDGPRVSLSRIPNKMSPFFETNDLWGKINFPDGFDIESCVYEFGDSSIFPKHVHEYGEAMFVLSGRIKVKMYSGEKDNLVLESETVVNQFESIYIPPNMWHEAEALEEDKDGDFDVKICCFWFTDILGWVSDFAGVN